MPAPVVESKRVETDNIFDPTYQSLSGDDLSYHEFILDGDGYDGPDSRYNFYHVVRGRASLVVTKTRLATVNAHTAPDILVECNDNVVRTGRMVGPMGNHGFAFRHIDGSLSTSYPPTPESSDVEGSDAESSDAGSSDAGSYDSDYDSDPAATAAQQ